MLVPVALLTIRGDGAPAAARKRKLLAQRGRNPGILLVRGGARHAHPGAIEHLFRGHALAANFLHQLADEQAALRGAVLDEPAGRARRRRIENERAERCADRRESFGTGLAETALERVAARRIDDRDLDVGAALVHLGEDVVEADALRLHLALVPDVDVDGNEIALPVRLDPVSAEEDEAGHPALELRVEAVDGALHLVFREVLPHLHVEAGALELVSERAGIVDRLLERRDRRPTCNPELPIRSAAHEPLPCWANAGCTQTITTKAKNKIKRMPKFPCFGLLPDESSAPRALFPPVSGARGSVRLQHLGVATNALHDLVPATTPGALIMLTNSLKGRQ